MTLPTLCEHHSRVYATRLNRLKNRVHHPTQGRKALYREARQIAGQCSSCLNQETP